MKELKQENKGQSLLEVIVAMTIFALIGAVTVVMITGSFTGLVQGGEQTEAEALAQEGLEAVRSIRDGAWNEIIYYQSAVASSTSQWVFSGEDTSENIGQYTRTITFEDVCRDSSNNITTCPGEYTDIQSKKVIVIVSWEVRSNITNEVKRIAYITNWDSQDWQQTDWSGGNEQTVWSDITKYSSDDSNIVNSTAGQISLVSGDTQDNEFNNSTNLNYNWPFSVAENYIYDSNKIEVIGNQVQLKLSGGSSSSDETLNEEFTTNANNWTFSIWDGDPDEIIPTGAWQSSGGDLGGYININMPYNTKSDEVGGYWEQLINITENDASVTCYFDWKITQWIATRGVDDYQFYVFLDSSTGEPIIGNEIWSSGIQSGVTSWSGQESIDCSSIAATSGTYYYKIAVWLDANVRNTGPITAGYDNAKVSWEKIAGESYPTDKPTIYPNDSFSVSGEGSWSSFTEIATKNGGEIYYQLSDDDGVTWQYWNGSSWVIAGLSDYNIATVVDTNISDFPTDNEQIMFKAFLESDGTQQVQLDDVNISYATSGSVWGFNTWDVGLGEVTPIGLHNQSGGNPDGYVEITVPESDNDQVGGYWEQSFTTYRDNPTDLSINFDYKVIDFNNSPNVAHVKVYVDTASGPPATQVGNSISLSAEGSWISASTIDPSAAITTAGIYYLKIAYWLETLDDIVGPFTVGFDNVDINLGNGNYPIYGDLISSDYDIGSVAMIQAINWDEILSSCEPVCEVQFQIKTADSQVNLDTAEWCGPDGKDGDEIDYFVTSGGELIHTDHNGDQWIRYKVGLSGDGADTPILQEVLINYK